MQQLQRSAFVAAMLVAMLAAPGARAADAVPAGDHAAQAMPGDTARYTRNALPIVTLAPSFALDGIWVFDASHSDDPMKMMQASRPQGGGGGPRMGGGMGGGRRGGEGGWGGRGGAGMGAGGDDAAGGDHADQPAENRPRGPSPMARVMRPAKKLVIDMQADQVVLTEDEGAARPYAIADSLKAHGHELLTENTSAQWKSGKLEMTQAMGQRGKLVETYEVSHDGKMLTIHAHREGGREGMPNPTFTRVYTRYDGE